MRARRPQKYVVGSRLCVYYDIVAQWIPNREVSFGKD
jgi:hypothetical protein